MVPVVHAWALGIDLDELLAEEELTGGDFVRNVRRVIDLLRHIGEAAPKSDTRKAARSAMGDLDRGPGRGGNQGRRSGRLERRTAGERHGQRTWSQHRRFWLVSIEKNSDWGSAGPLRSGAYVAGTDAELRHHVEQHRRAGRKMLPRGWWVATCGQPWVPPVVAPTVSPATQLGPYRSMSQAFFSMVASFGSSATWWPGVHGGEDESWLQ